MKNNSRKIKVLHCVGARPNFMKIAPIMQEMSKYPNNFSQILVHTGQHYDKEMSQSFFNDLGLPSPDIYLGVGSGTHAEQTGKVMIEFEKKGIKEKPDLVIVVGDVNSTLACALVASKLSIQVAHIEAGLRSFDRTMPEEINRILTDKISDFLFTTCEDANTNLLNEGISKDKIHFVGNVMIDSILKHIELAEKSNILIQLGLRTNGDINKYALITLHRPSNVDYKETLGGILNAMNELNNEIPVIFPAHPRTIKQIKKHKLHNRINYINNYSSYKPNSIKEKISIFPPLNYIDFISLMSNAAMVLTDSGGIQEETTILGIPCLTLRPNTERPITIKQGTNKLVGNDPQTILSEAHNIIENEVSQKKAPRYWDGKAAKRIVKVLTSK
ncbi:MAG: UDP-N-acetylglucosamine 2-epimerase (non-hydrolyzing) [Deltaproteobacteria bacterium]|nr:UDP-N-acetylglucosamine 2-epimerase (non-hydrolyzing) [Deltaproteobacteria bacterium]